MFSLNNTHEKGTVIVESITAEYVFMIPILLYIIKVGTNNTTEGIPIIAYRQIPDTL